MPAPSWYVGDDAEAAGDRLAADMARVLASPLWLRRKFFQAQRYPRLIYKYRSIDPSDHASVQRLKDFLLGSRLWLASPASFNDPFDMGARFIFKLSTGTKRDRLKALAKGKLGSRKERRQRVKELLVLPNAQLSESGEAAYRANVREMGVCSFADDPRSILMWSHYAEKHTGVCLQFDVARDPETFMLALRVDYSSEYPFINWANPTAVELRRTLLKKNDDWDYEEERRIVIPGRANTPWPFESAALTGIILGCQIANDTEAEVFSILRERDARGMPAITVFRAHKHPSRYRLLIRCDDGARRTTIKPLSP